MVDKKVKPFLKWAGGKTQLLSEIETKITYKRNDSFTYIEPFVGSGAVLFWVLSNFPNLRSAVINDINEDLINVYKIIKTDVHDLISILKKYEDEYHRFSGKEDEKKEYYYEKRSLFNRRDSDNLTQAALFIFLNKTCFNGLYRVNKNNQFNVPIGSYKAPTICDRTNLLVVSELLQKVTILTGDYEQTITYADRDALFYFDPPYKPLSKTSSFNSYAKYEFDDSEQIRLKEFCDELTNLECKWILSNSDVRGKDPSNNFFDELFSNYQINRVSAKRFINSDSNNRGSLTELLIANMEVV